MNDQAMLEWLQCISQIVIGALTNPAWKGISDQSGLEKESVISCFINLNTSLLKNKNINKCYFNKTSLLEIKQLSC